jgi:DNA-binding XRE family transcriptional regulator
MEPEHEKTIHKPGTWRRLEPSEVVEMAHAEYKASGEDAKKMRRQAGAYIKGLRSDAELTQQELARRLGLEYYTFVSQVENGTARVPPEAYKQWAEALKVELAAFVKTLLSYYDPHTYKALFGTKGTK